MDLHFYSDLTESTGQHGDPEFLDPQSFNGFDAVSKFPGGGDNYLTITGSGHPFLTSSETFHTPSLGDEEFEIPPISLDPDSALTVSDVVSHFGELSDGGPPGSAVVPGNAVVGGDDPSFSSTYVNPPSQGLEHLSLGLISQPGGGTLLGSALGMFSSSSPMTIDVPLSDMGHSLLSHNQLTTIDQSELSAQLGLSLGGGTILPRPQSPDQPLSATISPSGSLQDDDMDDFRRSVLVESPISLSAAPGVISLDPPFSDPPLHAASGSAPPALARKGGDGGGGGGGGGRKGKKKKDPNEPQKPVSAYALFFRDTQAAIKGQNPNATFGEVSKIVASMWDSLEEEQKQVYKRKTEAAKREYLKLLAAYRASQFSQPTIEVLDSAPSPPPPPPPPEPSPAPGPAQVTPSGGARSGRPPHHNPDQNTITNICTSNIILDLPQVSTRSRTGAIKPAAPPPPDPPTVTKIIIKHQGGVATVTPTSSSSARQPPPLQQMQHTPPPPRLQQMVHAQAPPPLQAKPRGGGGAGQGSASLTTAPPPLQIKIVPASLQADLATPIIVTSAGATPTSVSSPSSLMEVGQSGAIVTAGEEVAEGEEGMEVEVTVAPGPTAAPSASHSVCVRAGCTNPAVESKDWDREYCSNECVATHCRDVFKAWCDIRGQNSTTVT